MGFTQTTNYNLDKPDRNEVDWDDEVNADCDKIDAQMKINEDKADGHVTRHEDGGADALTGANIEGIVRAALAAATAAIDVNGQNILLTAGGIGNDNPIITFGAGATGQATFAGRLGWTATEYLSSDAAGYVDVHWADDDKGARFYSGANLLLSVRRISAGAPTQTEMVAPVGFSLEVGAGQLIYATATSLHLRASGSVKLDSDNVPLSFGAGSDAQIYYSNADLIIDPDVVGSGVVKIGVTADDQLQAGSVIVGNGTDQISVGATGDLLFQGSAGLAFGELWVLGNAVETAIGGAGTFVQYAGFANDGASNNTTPDSTQNHITITEPGVYEVTASFHVESVGAGAADLVSIEIRTNNGTVGYGNLHSHRKLSGGGGDVGSMSVSGLAEFADNDTVEVWITNDDNPTNLLVADANIRVCQYGGATSAPSSSSSSSSSSSP